MSDKLLKALMQLFAIVANAGRLTEQGRAIVENFLQQQLNPSLVQLYLSEFDRDLQLLQGKAEEGKTKKRVSVNSVKVLRICTEINSELNQKQKQIVLIRLIEFAYSSDENIAELELEFLSTVANVFNISNEEFEISQSYASHRKVNEIVDVPEILLINKQTESPFVNSRHVKHEYFDGDLLLLHIKSTDIIFARYFGKGKITINGSEVMNDAAHVLSQGSVIRSGKAQPIYYNDIIRSFLNDAQQSEIKFSVSNVEYVFHSGKIGLHNTNFEASSGNLIGIMGGSGAGKSTLLNILNSNLSPARGEVLVNGINLHTQKEKLEGIIGFVPQDDLLMEDLTVFQNLFYNSKLCFGNLSNIEIVNKVYAMLQSLGLLEIKDLKVGDPLNKTISGGQRKRLNIALELIRTPSILFVDEPTSGLSSLDSETVMDLLKQLAVSGKLVFVVIHQPSSEIFKLFDKLLLLDTGGYPIYYGNPVDSLIHFKQHAMYADSDVSMCESCGNINPEQVFSIIETKVVDEFGKSTNARKFLPTDWYNFHNSKNITNDSNIKPTNEIEKGDYHKPSRWKQIGVYIMRDINSKLNNTQYILINFLEAPVLAFILAYFLRYSKNNGVYIFSENVNLPAYIFMCVIVALFMGLTSSAEEIIRDRKILKREKFLNLSRFSYLFSKTSIMFFISAIQTATFVMVGNFMFGIHDMYLCYWLVLFSASCFANLMGLNISATFNSVVTIYILIPFLIIPQIILSGVIVKFYNLNPVVTTQNKVPPIGEIMASRWAFEALAVHQFKENKYAKLFFEIDKATSNANFKKGPWMEKMNDKLDSLHGKFYGAQQQYQLQLFNNELQKELAALGNYGGAYSFNYNRVIDDAAYNKLKEEFKNISKQYNVIFNTAAAKREAIVNRLGEKNITLLKQNYNNESLNDMVTDKLSDVMITEEDGELIQKFRPVYLDGSSHSFVRAQFYVSRKNVFGHYISTFAVNIIVLWLMTLFLCVALYFNWLKIALHYGSAFVDLVKAKLNNIRIFRKKSVPAVS